MECDQKLFRLIGFWNRALIGESDSAIAADTLIGAILIFILNLPWPTDYQVERTKTFKLSSLFSPKMCFLRVIEFCFFATDHRN